MRIINRSIVLIKAKHPFLDWLNKTPYSIPVTLREVNQDCTAILIPDFESVAELLIYIEQNKPNWFALVLATWKPDQTTWPQQRTPQLFDFWFDLEIHSTVWDDSTSTPSAIEASSYLLSPIEK